MKHGCNNYNAKVPKSTPMGFWTQQDVLAYLLVFNVSYAPTYGKIEYDPVKDELYTTREHRTGCYNCMYGVPYETQPNRFQRMKKDYPQLHKVCENQGCFEVLQYMRLPYE